MMDFIYGSVIWFVNEFGLYMDLTFYAVVILLTAMDINRSRRLRNGDDIIIQPNLTLFTDDGDKIHVIATNEEQGRYVLYHSKHGGLTLATRSDFLKLKSRRET